MKFKGLKNVISNKKECKKWEFEIIENFNL